MADGGEGTAEVVSQALGASWVKCKAHDPLSREIEARYGWIDNRRLAVMEMSEAAGMRRLAQNELDPTRATTLGVGEMILDAAKRGAEEIIIGLGGSATNDGGFGMARSLGFRFLTSVSLTTALSTWLRGKRIEVPELTGPVTELRTLDRIEKRSREKRERGWRDWRGSSASAFSRWLAARLKIDKRANFLTAFVKTRGPG